MQLFTARVHLNSQQRVQTGPKPVGFLQQIEKVKSTNDKSQLGSRGHDTALIAGVKLAWESVQGMCMDMSDEVFTRQGFL